MTKVLFMIVPLKLKPLVAADQVTAGMTGVSEYKDESISRVTMGRCACLEDTMTVRGATGSDEDFHLTKGTEIEIEKAQITNSRMN